jgi:hypothetical protein
LPNNLPQYSRMHPFHLGRFVGHLLHEKRSCVQTKRFVYKQQPIRLWSLQ